tara:strand:+ start:243 stop:845 length:603 start_codon:yes stop_codon:yes gene_type:complete
MSSEIKANTISEVTSANGVSIDGLNIKDSSINTGAIGSAVTGFTGIKNADQWRLTANHTGAGGDLTSNFERTDDLDFGQIGTGMTQSAGIFTFPDTGKWIINVIGQWTSANGGITYAGIRIYATHNAGSGDTYDIKTINYANMDSTGYYQSTSGSFIFDVTNVATHKMKFHAEKSVGDATLQGGTNYNMTTFTFLRLGDT